MDIALLEDAAQAIRITFPQARPEAGLILGSGWSDVAAAFHLRGKMDYGAIPGMGRTGVVGHAGVLLWGELAGIETLVFQGRRHWYEGEGWTPVAIPVFAMKTMGIQRVLLTNAAGGIRRDLVPGNLMVISDHINGMGVNPLQGPHNPAWGARFPDMSEAYSGRLRTLLRKAAEDLKLPVSEGVYLAASGPSYETPAEIRAYRTLGADAVGMSTVPEAILANAAGIEVAGLSCISNAAAGISTQPLSHEEVTDTTRQVMPAMKRLVEVYWSKLAELG